MASPASNINSEYTVVVRRNHDNRPRAEVTAQQLAEFVIPILGNHHDELRYHDRVLGNHYAGLRAHGAEINQLNTTVIHIAADLNQLTEHLDEIAPLQTQALHHLQQQIIALNGQVVEQRAEIRRLGDLPCNRLQRTVTSWCTYL